MCCSFFLFAVINVSALIVSLDSSLHHYLKDSVMRKVVHLRPWGDGLDPNHWPHLGFPYSWSAVQLLQFFNCLSSRCKTSLMTFRNCCVSKANFACWCWWCSPLPTSVRTAGQQCQPPPPSCPHPLQARCCIPHTPQLPAWLTPPPPHWHNAHTLHIYCAVVAVRTLLLSYCWSPHSIRVWTATTAH